MARMEKNVATMWDKQHHKINYNLLAWWVLQGGENIDNNQVYFY